MAPISSSSGWWGLRDTGQPGTWPGVFPRPRLLANRCRPCPRATDQRRVAVGANSSTLRFSGYWVTHSSVFSPLRSHSTRVTRIHKHAEDQGLQVLGLREFTQETHRKALSVGGKSRFERRSRGSASKLRTCTNATGSKLRTHTDNTSLPGTDG